MPRNKTGLPWADYLNSRVSQHKRALPPSAGLYCTACRGTHPYNGTHKLGLDYEYRNGHLVLLWLCPITDNLLEVVTYV
jgi:hypothetical protein